MKLRNRSALAAGSMLAAFALLTSCSSAAEPSTDNGGSSDQEAVASSGTVYMDTATGQCENATPIDGFDVDRAFAVVDEFQDPATELFFDTVLPEAPSPDTLVVFLNNGSVVTGIMQENLERAAAAAEVQFANVSTGTDAQTINSALNSVVEMAPDILISVAHDGTFFIDQIEELRALGTSIVYASIPNADEFGLDDSLSGAGAADANGRTLMSAAVAFTCGTVDEFVFYHIPEYGFSQQRLEAAQAEMAEIAPGANMRVVDISIMDPSPADKIVSDLQAHPETQFFLTPADQFQVGLTEKANLAGLENAIGIGQSSVPANFQQILDGQQFAGYADDFGMFMWQLLDEGLRKDQGIWDEYGDWNRLNKTHGQIITLRNAAEYNTADGFIAYPDYQEDFKALWNK